MDAWWYYSEDGETVGPTSVEEIANWIRQAKSQSHFVWTEGMPEWTEAGTVPEFSTEFQAAGPALASNAKFGAETKRACLGLRRARRELFVGVDFRGFCSLSFEADYNAVGAQRQLQPLALRVQAHGDALIVVQP
jgi:hypothetical protein